MTDAMRTLFTQGLDVLLNNIEEKTLTQHQVNQLYEWSIPDGVVLPFCVQHKGTNQAWFVPIDDDNVTWKSCLLFDAQLSADVRVTQAVYSTPQWPHITVGGRMQRPYAISSNPYEAVDMLVWLVCEILNRGRWKQGDDPQRRMLHKQDYEFVMNCLQQITEKAATAYPAAFRFNSLSKK